MKKNFLALGTCAFALGLVACDDSTSANGSFGDENPAEVSSSSVIASEAKQSSSSVIVSSSSTPTEDPGSSSSSVILSGGSAGVEGSSCSVTSSSSVESSSSVVSSSSEKSSSSVASSSSVKSGSSVADKANWAYLNPSIDYGEFTDARDGQVYKTVKICDDKDENCQTWLAENLNYAYKGVKYNYDGFTSDSTSWCYGNDPSYCATYGRLYTWAAAVDSVAIYEKYGEKCGYGRYCTRFSASALATAPVRGVCPSGWHLPSNAEWSALYTNVGGTSYAGQKLKANTSLWYSNTGTDEYGFSVLPAGDRYGSGKCSNRGYHAYFWSSTEYESYYFYAWSQNFRNHSDYVYQDYGSEYSGFSVRCLKD